MGGYVGEGSGVDEGFGEGCLGGESKGDVDYKKEDLKMFYFDCFLKECKMCIFYFKIYLVF